MAVNRGQIERPMIKKRVRIIEHKKGREIITFVE